VIALAHSLSEFEPSELLKFRELDFSTVTHGLGKHYFDQC
jgi:hypothetical protein